MKKILIGFLTVLATIAIVGCNQGTSGTNGTGGGVKKADLLGNWKYIEAGEGSAQEGTITYIFRDDDKVYSIVTSHLGDENQADYETEQGTYTTKKYTQSSFEYDISIKKQDGKTYLIFKTYNIQVMKFEKIEE